MKSAVVILTLLGCDCDGVVCEHIRTVSSDWTSIESCEASSDFRRVTTDWASYPLVVAQCSVDGRDSVPLEVAHNEQTGAAADGQAGAGGALFETGEANGPGTGKSLQGLLVSGAANSIQTIRSGLKTYAVEPVRVVSSWMLAGLRD